MRKKLFAILMSAMMMVTFMPAMAFAGTPVAPTTVKFWKYSEDYSKVVCYTNVEETETITLPAARTFDPDTGIIKVQGTSSTAYTVTGTTTNYYYDLSNITLYNQSQFEAANYVTNYGGKKLNETSFVVKSPDFVKETETDVYGSWIVNTGLAGWTVSVDWPEYDLYSYANQTLTTPVLIASTSGTEVAASETYPDVVGTLAAHSFTVKKATPSIHSAKFFFDKVGKDSAALTERTEETVNYDGASHALVMRDIPGAKVSYSVLNTTTGKYEAVESVSIKDVTTPYVTVKALVEKGTVGGTGTDAYDSEDYTFYLNATQALGFRFAFDTATWGGKAVADNCNPADLMKVTYVENPATDDAAKAQNAANKAAALANMNLVKEYFNDFFEFVKTPGKADENAVNIAVKAKDLTGLSTAELTALQKKYAQLDANIDGLETMFTNGDNINVVLNGGDIEWVKAPLSKTYKAKKGKLAKTKMFTIKATAAAKVTYKLTKGAGMIKINKTTGKVTVKKGLKKGTYKVVVYAFAGTEAADFYTLKIKVK